MGLTIGASSAQPLEDAISQGCMLLLLDSVTLTSCFCLAYVVLKKETSNGRYTLAKGSFGRLLRQSGIINELSFSVSAVALVSTEIYDRSVSTLPLSQTSLCFIFLNPSYHSETSAKRMAHNPLRL